MFGYISIDKPELKIKDFETYKSYYCGLCKTLKKEYSLFSSFLLNYDLTFFYLLSAGIRKEPACFEKKHCIVNPLKPCFFAKAQDAEFAAGLTVLLALESIKDHAKDDHNLLYSLLFRFYKRQYQKAKDRFPKAQECIETALSLLAEKEAAKTANLDEVADVFATMLANLFAMLGGEEKVLHRLGYHLGRWIYLIDAYDDLEEDKKKGRYNPLLLQEKQQKEALTEQIRYNLNACIYGASCALDLLEIEKHRSILENIVMQGLEKRTKLVIEGKKGKQKRYGSL